MALHYNVDIGIDYFGGTNNIFILPFLGLLFFVINLIIFILVRNNQDRRLIGHILFVVALICNFTLLIGLGSIYLINSR